MTARTRLSRGASGLPHQEADQAELRRKRRARHLHTYGPDWSLSAEVEAICSGLAARVMLRDNATAFYADEVDLLADSVFFAAARLAGMIARANAAAHAAKLPIEVRGRELKRIADAAAARVPRPVIDASALATGTWISTLTALVSPLSEPLSALLAAPVPATAHSAPSASGRLEELLRGIDDAAAALARKLKSAESRPAVAAPHHVEPITQEQVREARRAKMPFSWPAQFSLPAEIQAICQPAAAALAASPDPASLSAAVNRLIGAVYEAVVEVADMVVRTDAAAGVAHVRDLGERGRAKKLIIGLAPRPQRPTLSEAQLVAGTWVAPLVRLGEPYREGFAKLLAASARINGEPVSEKLEVALAHIDSAALSLERRIEALHRRDARPGVAAPPVRVSAAGKDEAARAELLRLGVAPP